MKKANDPRHLRRIHLVQKLFAESFSPDVNKKDPSLSKIHELQEKTNQLIEEAAPQFPLAKIAKVDVAILRLSIFELLFEKKEPEKVIIDEAVELAKEFGGEGSPSFVNGVLGNLLKKRETQIKSV